jgi:predicted carbohydrate-binding protein with CBM48
MNELDEEGVGRQVGEAYRRSATPSPGARARLIERLGRVPPPHRDRFAWARLADLSPASSRLVMAASVLLVAAGALIVRELGPNADAPGVPAPSGADASPSVRFELAAPGAAGVTLVGDFNGWDRRATPMRRASASDVWTVSVPLGRGRHAYGFVIDGNRWVADPSAPLAPVDGFGGANSIIVVNGPGSS